MRLSRFLSVLYEQTEPERLRKNQLVRAQRMGFDTNRVYYHGTTHDIEQFDLDRSGSNMQMTAEGPVVWFSSDPNVAEIFANKSQWLGDDAEAMGNNITPVYLRLQNPFSVDAREFEQVDKERTLVKARRAGFDGVLFRGLMEITIRSDVVAVFDPSRIRSIYAKFNKSRADSPNLTEAPITDYEFRGPSTPRLPGKFRQSTLDLVRSPKARQKAIRVFANTPWNIRVVFDNTLPYGEDAREWEPIRPQPGTITVAFDNDKGDNFIPFTPWMIAHRLGHAIPDDNPFYMNVAQRLISLDLEFQRIVLFDAKLPLAFIGSFYHAAGKFKSARDAQVGDKFEFLLDCLAQFLIQGSVSFNTVTNPVMGRNFIRHDAVPNQPAIISPSFLEDVNYEFTALADRMNREFPKLMDSLVGKVLDTVA